MHIHFCLCVLQLILYYYLVFIISKVNPIFAKLLNILGFQDSINLF